MVEDGREEQANKPTGQQANRPTRRQRKQLNIIVERKPSTKASIRKGSA